MSNYTIQVGWSGKDALNSSDPEKIISGDDLNTEFAAVQTALNSKVDTTSGTTTGHTLVNPIINTGVSGSAVLDEDNMASNSATKLSTQQSIKAYADGLKSTSENLTNKTITSPVLNTGVSGSAILDEDNLASNSATKLASQQSIKAYADALKSATETLSNKSVNLNANTVTGTLAEFNTAVSNANLASLAGSETLTNKTLTSAVLNTAISGSAFLDEDNLASNSATKVASQQSIKAYVDAKPATIGALAIGNNLSDLSSVSTARSNLGLIIGTNVLAPNGNGSNLTGINTDPQLGFKNVSSWANNAVESVTLNPAASAIGKASVKVWEEVPQAGLTNGNWNIATGDTGFSRTNTAYSQTLTPAATTGDAIAFTLGSGNWASTDVGKIITNTSASENGVARIKSVSSGVATCKITTNFTNTDAIASGDWSLSMIEFVDNAAVLASVGGGPVAGTEKQVYAGYSEQVWTVNLTATKAVQVWVGGSGIWVSILTIAADDTITTVPASNTRTRLTSDTSVTGIYAVALNATTVVIGYNDIPNSQYFTMMAFTVLGTNITQGSPTVVGNIDMGAELVIARMSNTHGIAFVKDDTNTDISAYGFSVSGTSITQGGRVAISTTASETIDCSSLSASKAVGFWSISGVTYMRTINLSGTTASTGGAQATIGSGLAYSNGSCRLTSTKILFVSHPGKAYVITENGSGGLSAGAPLTFGSLGAGGRGDVNCCRMSDTEAAIFFVSSNGPVVQLVDIGSTTATLKGSPLVLSGAGAVATTGQLLSTNRLIAGYRLGPSPHGATARVISISSPQFVTGQHACTISGSDSVDTTFYDDLNSVTVTETLNSKLANYAFSVNSTPSAQEVTGGSFFIIGDGETSVRTIASSLAAVTGGNAGVWHYNTNTSYGGATYTITVQSVSGANKYFVNGSQQATITLVEGDTYLFNYPAGHPFRFSTTSNGTHAGGAAYTDGVTIVSTTQLKFVVPYGAPTLYYYCSSHTAMGGTANTSASSTWSAAATNEAKAAIQQAETIAKNRMTGTAVNNVSDANWPALGTQFSVAITLFTDADTASPTVGGVAFNYDGSIINRDKTHAYTIEMPSTSVVQVKAPSSGNARNARVYISK